MPDSSRVSQNLVTTLQSDRFVPQRSLSSHAQHHHTMVAKSLVRWLHSLSPFARVLSIGYSLIRQENEDCCRAKYNKHRLPLRRSDHRKACSSIVHIYNDYSKILGICMVKAMLFSESEQCVIEEVRPQ